MKKVVANLITKEQSVSNGDTVDNPVVTLSKKNNDHSSLPVPPKTKGAKAKKKITKKQKAGKPSVSKTRKISSVSKLSTELSAMRLRKCPKKINMRGFDESVSSNGAVTSEHELRYKIVDYFDYDVLNTVGQETPVRNYWFKLNQSLLKEATGPGALVPALRVGNVNLYCLPRSNVSTGDTLSQEVFTVLFSVPVSPTTGASPTVLGMNQRTTTIHPDYDISWHHVGSYKLDSVLKSGLYRPLLHENTTDGVDICLFQFQLIDPDNNDLWYQKPVQFKLVFDVYEPLPLLNFLQINLQESATFTTVVDPVMDSEPVFVDLLSMNTNKF